MTEAVPPFRLSRESRIRIDRDGRFWHEGERVVHPRLERALASWVDLDEATGRYVLRNALDWCFVTVDDTPLVVRGVRLDPDAGTLGLALSDGQTEEVTPDTLWVDGEGVPYGRVRAGRLPARFDRHAAFALLAHAEPGAQGGIRLRLGARLVEVPQRERPGA